MGDHASPYLWLLPLQSGVAMNLWHVPTQCHDLVMLPCGWVYDGDEILCLGELYLCTQHTQVKSTALTMCVSAAPGSGMRLIRCVWMVVTWWQPALG